jgi:hypothetical protein
LKVTVDSEGAKLECIFMMDTKEFIAQCKCPRAVQVLCFQYMDKTVAGELKALTRNRKHAMISNTASRSPPWRYSAAVHKSKNNAG